jgi:hypothetical protein
VGSPSALLVRRDLHAPGLAPPTKPGVWAIRTARTPSLKGVKTLIWVEIVVAHGSIDPLPPLPAQFAAREIIEPVSDSLPIEELPPPHDDDAVAHLPGVQLPAIELPSTEGGSVVLSDLVARTVVFVHPSSDQIQLTPV